MLSGKVSVHAIICFIAILFQDYREHVQREHLGFKEDKVLEISLRNISGHDWQNGEISNKKKLI